MAVGCMRHVVQGLQGGFPRFINKLCFADVETEALGNELADPGPLGGQLGPGLNYIVR